MSNGGPTPFEEFVNTELPLRVSAQFEPSVESYLRFKGFMVEGLGVEELTSAAVCQDVLDEIDTLADADAGIDPAASYLAIWDDTASVARRLTLDSLGGSAQNLGDLNDVTLTSPQELQVLAFGGAEWNNAFLSFPFLSDVDVTGADANNRFLRFDGADTWFAHRLVVNDLGDMQEGDALGNMHMFGQRWTRGSLLNPAPLPEFWVFAAVDETDPNNWIANDPDVFYRFHNIRAGAILGAASLYPSDYKTGSPERWDDHIRFAGRGQSAVDLTRTGYGTDPVNDKEWVIQVQAGFSTDPGGGSLGPGIGLSTLFLTPIRDDQAGGSGSVDGDEIVLWAEGNYTAGKVQTNPIAVFSQNDGGSEGTGTRLFEFRNNARMVVRQESLQVGEWCELQIDDGGANGWRILNHQETNLYRFNNRVDPESALSFVAGSGGSPAQVTSLSLDANPAILDIGGDLGGVVRMISDLDLNEVSNHDILHMFFELDQGIVSLDNANSWHNWHSRLFSSGVGTEGFVFSTTSTSFSVTAGTAFLRPTTDPTSQLTLCDVAALASTPIAQFEVQNVFMEWNSGAPRLVARTTSSGSTSGRDEVFIGSVLRDEDTVTAFKAGWKITDFSRDYFRRLGATSASVLVGGSALGTSGAGITYDSGIFFLIHSEFVLNSFDSDAGADTFTSVWDGGSLAGETDWNNTQYDTGAGLATMQPNRWNCSWYWRSFSGKVYEQIGPYNLGTPDAIALTPDNAGITTPSWLSDTCVLTSRLLFDTGALVPAEILNLTGGGGSSGGGSSTTTFLGLIDTFSSYAGRANQAVVVTSGEDGLDSTTVLTAVEGDTAPRLGGNLDFNLFDLGMGTGQTSFDINTRFGTPLVSFSSSQLSSGSWSGLSINGRQQGQSVQVAAVTTSSQNASLELSGAGSGGRVTIAKATLGGVTHPDSGGTDGQVLTMSGTLSSVWATPAGGGLTNPLTEDLNYGGFSGVACRRLSGPTGFAAFDIGAVTNDSILTYRGYQHSFNVYGSQNLTLATSSVKIDNVKTWANAGLQVTGDPGSLTGANLGITGTVVTSGIGTAATLLVPSTYQAYTDGGFIVKFNGSQYFVPAFKLK